MSKASEKGSHDSKSDSKQAETMGSVKSILDVVGGNINYKPPSDKEGRKDYKEAWDKAKK